MAFLFEEVTLLIVNQIAVRGLGLQLKLMNSIFVKVLSA
jgi:hypothetical protein